MSQMVEINVVVPKKIKILVPRRLFEEFEQMVKEENLSTIITEALTEELKKVRFRTELEKAASKVA
jgi:hypothetical protein